MKVEAKIKADLGTPVHGHRTPLARALCLASLLSIGGCSGSPAIDAGLFDAGPDAGDFDASWMDAGDASPDDGGVDAGPDAATEPDASTDAGFDAGMDAGFDAGPDAGFDAGMDAGFDGGFDAGPATCSIVGDYAAVFLGSTVYFRFNADNTWSFAPSRAGLATSPYGGTYSLTGSTFTIMDNPSTGCPISAVGTYTLTWSPSCSWFSLTLVSDPCFARGSRLNGNTFVQL